MIIFFISHFQIMHKICTNLEQEDAWKSNMQRIHPKPMHHLILNWIIHRPALAYKRQCGQLQSNTKGFLHKKYSNSIVFVTNVTWEITLKS